MTKKTNLDPRASTSLSTTSLSTDLNLRPARWTDVEGVAKLIYDVCEANGDTAVALTPEDLESEWKTPGFNLETDAFVVETKDGHVVGFEELMDENEHVEWQTDGYVHPQFKGLGIGTSLLRKTGERAQELLKLAEPDLRVLIHSTIDNKDEQGHELHKTEGFSPVRYHWRMEIKLQEAPPPVTFPAGIELRPFLKDEHAAAACQAENEAFRENWGSTGITYEDWVQRRLGNPDFDPNLWLVAWDGDQIAGFSQNRYRMEIGWVSILGVRPPWRKTGLGLALLQHSFGEFYKRGTSTIGLTVDAANPTGATRLYQRAGMFVASEFATYEKELRPGRGLE